MSETRNKLVLKFKVKDINAMFYLKLLTYVSMLKQMCEIYLKILMI